jgi:putative flippase GtrA
MTAIAGRWLKFNAAGLLGVGVQTGVLAFMDFYGVRYLAATVVAVECAVLHNFIWHERWTWRDRAQTVPRGWMCRLWRFQMTNGLISIVGNVALMAWLVGILHGPVVVSNIVTIILCSTANFMASDGYVFAGPRSGDTS